MSSLTIVIPTQGRQTLPRCLRSLDPSVQRGRVAEILVVGDTHDADPEMIGSAIHWAKAYGARYLPYDAGYHDWGYPQLRYGYEKATGAWIMNMGDDDVYVPDAIPTILNALKEVGEGPVMFRAEMHPSPNRANFEPAILWSERVLREKVITGQNMATPNVPGKVGGWINDWKHALETVALWDGQVTWRHEIIARCF